MALALGGTVADLQRRMTMREVQLWMSYRRIHGPLNYERRFDRPAAMIGHILSRAYGGKATFKDLMPYGRDADASADSASIEDIINEIGGVKVKNG